MAYVSEQNLELDDSGAPLRNPQIDEAFVRSDTGRYVRRTCVLN